MEYSQKERGKLFHLDGKSCDYTHMWCIGVFRFFYRLDGSSFSPKDITASIIDDVPDYIIEQAEAFIQAYTIFTNRLKLKEPLSSKYFPDTEYIDVLIDDIPEQKGLVSGTVTTMERCLNGVKFCQGSAIRIRLHRDLIKKSATPIHELFHVFQYAYTPFTNGWFMEGLARWSQNLTHTRKMHSETLPRSLDELDILLDRSHDAEYFWRKIWESIGEPDLFWADLLNETAKAAYELEERSKEGISYWRPEHKRSKLNNLFLLNALRRVLLKYSAHNEISDVLSMFITLIEDHAKVYLKSYQENCIQVFLRVLSTIVKGSVISYDSVLLSPVFSVSDGILKLKKVDLSTLEHCEIETFCVVKKIAGTLYISASSLEHLSGLNSIEEIDTLHISNMDALVDINGFNALSSLQNLFIHKNRELKEINGFSRLFKVSSSVGGSIKITNNPKLTSVAFLRGLEKTGSSFYLHHNGLVTVEGLNRLQEVGASLSLSSNRLSSLTPLGNLKEVRGMFGVAFNCLKSLEGLESLERVHTIKWNGNYRSLALQGNRDLEDVSALKRLKSVKGHMIIYLDSAKQYQKKVEKGSDFSDNIFDIYDTDMNRIDPSALIEGWESRGERPRILFGHNWKKATAACQWLEAFHIRPSSAKEVIDLCKELKIDILFGNNYTMQRWLLNHRKELYAHGLGFIVNEWEILRLLVNKERFSQWMERHGFGMYVPAHYQDAANAEYPCIVKPESGGAGRGIYIASDPSEVPEQTEKIMLEAYLPGSDEYATSLFYKAGKILHIQSYKKSVLSEPFILQQEESVRIKPCETTFEALFLNIIDTMCEGKGYCLCSFNYKIVDGIPKIFEINPRTGYTLARHSEDFREMMALYIKEAELNNKVDNA